MKNRLTILFLVVAFGCGPKAGKKESSEPGPVPVVQPAPTTEVVEPETAVPVVPEVIEEKPVERVVTQPVGEIEIYMGTQWSAKVVEAHPLTGKPACFAYRVIKRKGMIVNLEVYSQYSSDETIKRYLEPVVLVHTTGVSEFVDGQFLLDSNRYQLRRADFFPFQQKGVKAGLGEFSQSKSLIEALLANSQGSLKLLFGSKNVLVTTFNTADFAKAFDAMKLKCSVEFLQFN